MAGRSKSTKRKNPTNRWGDSFKKGDPVQNSAGIYQGVYIKLQPATNFTRAYGPQALVWGADGPMPKGAALGTPGVRTVSMSDLKPAARKNPMGDTWAIMSAADVLHPNPRPGRKVAGKRPGAYALFVKKHIRKHLNAGLSAPEAMSAVAAEWRKAKAGGMRANPRKAKAPAAPKWVHIKTFSRAGMAPRVYKAVDADDAVRIVKKELMPTEHIHQVSLRPLVGHGIGDGFDVNVSYSNSLMGDRHMKSFTFLPIG